MDYMNRALEDKNIPRKPMSAYACFVHVINEEHNKKYSEKHVDFGDLARKCAERWMVGFKSSLEDWRPVGYDAHAEKALSRHGCVGLGALQSWGCRLFPPNGVEIDR